MKLRHYLKEEGIKIKSFAEKIGVTADTLRSALDGSRDITLSFACRVEELTSGIVKCRDLVNPFYMKKLEKRSKELKAKEK